MAIGTSMIFLSLAIWLVIVVGGVFLQIFLSKRESRWPGLILPMLTLCYAILMLLGIMIYDGMSGIEIVVTLGATFLLGNIPTYVLLGIYFACREKKKRKAQLDKMNIQDLE